MSITIEPTKKNAPSTLVFPMNTLLATVASPDATDDSIASEAPDRGEINREAPDAGELRHGGSALEGEYTHGRSWS